MASGVAMADAPSNVWELNIEKTSQAELIAATAMQGIANREEPQVFLQTGKRDWNMDLGSKWVNHTAEVLQRYKGVDDIWQEYYQKRYGYQFKQVSSLDELAAQLLPKLRGVVIYDEKNSGDVVMAVTIAGLRDVVPVTEKVLADSPVLRGLPVNEDLRGRFPDRLAAEREAIRTLLPQCSKDGAFSYGGGIDAVALDLAVSNRLFVYNLSHFLPNSPIEDKDQEKYKKHEGGFTLTDGPLVQTILRHLNPISPVWGWGGPREAIFLKTVSQQGDFVMCAQVPNGSFHQKISPPTLPFHQRHLRSEDVKVEPKHYVAFMVNEGDTLKCAASMMLNASWLESERGRFPINWGVSPYLCQNFPGMMDYFYETMTPNDYFFDGPAGYGYIMPEAFPGNLLFPFAEKTRAADAIADTRYAECWYFYGLKPEALRERWLAAMGIDGLTQWRGPQRIQFPPGCPPIIDSQHYYDKTTAEGIAKELIAESATAPRPWFTVVYAGTPHRFSEIMNQLPADRFKIVSLEELFIAAKKSQGKVEHITVKGAPPIPAFPSAP
jgi:hypothetical protein